MAGWEGGWEGGREGGGGTVSVCVCECGGYVGVCACEKESRWSLSFLLHTILTRCF